mmetsp:Transcript_27598/g.72950  ORF Transcript_27598/g.72950 Transcript_27598/m.72950 type:complete len:181 (+) Transcript_27598:90-632(+)
MHAAGDALNSLLGKDREPSLREQIEEATASGDTCFSLTYEERVIGFVACVASGMFLNCFSVIRLTELLLGNPVPFAVCFTLGNILSMGSMCFLVGPLRQCKNLFAPGRASATFLYLLMMACTLFSAFYPGLSHLGRVILIVICLVLQGLALAWYALSYIPFGMQFARRYLLRCCCPPEDV